MKMILLKDVPGLGRRHEVKEVSPGYARNYLVPRKLAAYAAPEALSDLERSVALEHEAEMLKKDLLRKNVESLEGQTITVRENANPEGHLYAGIHQKEIAVLVKRELRLDIPEECIILEKPLKELGTFRVKVKCEDRESTLTLFVEKA